jgi:UDP-N-acetylglucosamine diphosphorylase/glucosamine-1-phosphate N-acetyltransferase
VKNLGAIIMAAGKGTRMKDPSKAKVMYEILGKPMIHYVADLAYELEMRRVVVIIGHQREVVANYLRRSHPDVECIVQEEQLGTGHAVMQAKHSFRDFRGPIVVLSGDVPLLTKTTMKALLNCHEQTATKASILTAIMPNPTGYGRIIRNSDGSVQKIVEHRDASAGELQINEINSGIYVFERESLFDGLEHINSHNVQYEYYLTDVFEYFWKNKWRVSGERARDVDEIRGINTLLQLDEVRRIMETRRADSLLA